MRLRRPALPSGLTAFLVPLVHALNSCYGETLHSVQPSVTCVCSSCRSRALISLTVVRADTESIDVPLQKIPVAKKLKKIKMTEQGNINDTI